MFRKIFSAPKTLGIAALGLIGLLNVAHADTMRVTGIGSNGLLNVRQSPSIDAPIVVRLTAGTTGVNWNCQTRRNGIYTFYNIDFRGQHGWVVADYLQQQPGTRRSCGNNGEGAVSTNDPNNCVPTFGRIVGNSGVVCGGDPNQPEIVGNGGVNPCPPVAFGRQFRADCYTPQVVQPQPAPQPTAQVVCRTGNGNVTVKVFQNRIRIKQANGNVLVYTRTGQDTSRNASAFSGQGRNNTANKVVLIKRGQGGFLVTVNGNGRTQLRNVNC